MKQFWKSGNIDIDFHCDIIKNVCLSYVLHERISSFHIDSIMDFQMNEIASRPLFTVSFKNTIYDSGMWLSSRACTVETPSVNDAFDFLDSYKNAADDIIGTARQLESLTMHCVAYVSLDLIDSSSDTRRAAARAARRNGFNGIEDLTELGLGSPYSTEYGKSSGETAMHQMAVSFNLTTKLPVLDEEGNFIGMTVERQDEEYACDTASSIASLIKANAEQVQSVYHADGGHGLVDAGFILWQLDLPTMSYMPVGGQAY